MTIFKKIIIIYINLGTDFRLQSSPPQIIAINTYIDRDFLMQLSFSDNYKQIGYRKEKTLLGQWQINATNAADPTFMSLPHMWLSLCLPQIITSKRSANKSPKDKGKKNY